MNINTNPNKLAPALFLPSLLSGTEVIALHNVTKGEALGFVKYFNTEVEAARKVADAATPTPEPMEFIGGNLDLSALHDAGELEDLVETLSTSNLRGQRGRRAVFVDITANEIGVGTTVVYNQNRAMRGVLDTTVTDTVLSALEALADADA